MPEAFGDGSVWGRSHFYREMADRPVSIRRLETAAPWPPAVLRFGIRQGFGDGVIFIVKWQIALSLFGGWKPPLLGLRRF